MIKVVTCNLYELFLARFKLLFDNKRKLFLNALKIIQLGAKTVLVRYTTSQPLVYSNIRTKSEIYSTGNPTKSKIPPSRTTG